MTAGQAIRTVRLASGLVMLAFVTGHLLTVAAGLVSLPAISAAAGIFMRPWGSSVGGGLLMTAGLMHLLSGLHAIASRRSLTGRRSDAVQLALGLAVLPLLLPHVLAVSVAREHAPGFDVNFAKLLAFYWQLAPAYAIQQLLVIVVVWTHACIGLHGWMSLQRWWPKVGGYVTPLMFAVPILAILGFVEAGEDVLARLDSDPAFAADVARQWALLLSAQEPLQSIRDATLAAYWAAVALALAVLAARVITTRNTPVRVAYDGGLLGEGRRGLSVLEISRLSQVPHASVCSGRGRCGTCRVRVLEGARSLTPMDDVERRVLSDRRGEGRIRLACRARVLAGGVSVERLLPPDADASAARRPQDWLAARERDAEPAPAVGAEAAP